MVRPKICNRKFREWQYYKLFITSQDEKIDEEIRIDEMTWRRWLNYAFKRAHGLFGEGLEYYFIHQDDKVAYVKVNYQDKDLFSSAIATYVSSDELVGYPLIASIVQETSNLSNLAVSEHDKLWLQKEIEEQQNDNIH